jgi:7-cyano-7-deazaguanine synthase
MVTKALVILSGGQDSTTCLFWAKEHFDEVHAVTFNYGQRHIIEVEAARKVAELAGVASHEVIDVPNVLKSTSPLLSDTELERYDSAEEMESIIGSRVELTFVPMRNTFFFVIAMNRAVELGCRNLVTGICQEDNANYPDCTDMFRLQFQDMANTSLGVHLMSANTFKLHAPLMYMSKAETVKLAYSIPECWDALAYTHTSYDGKYPPTDGNHANVLRAHGFEVAGLPDPLVLRAYRDCLMPLPDTENYLGYH